MSTFEHASLQRGVTQYCWRGPRDAEQLVVVCGGFHFPRNCDAFFDELHAHLGAGSALLTFDAWGRGGSDAPLDVTWSAALYVEQVEQLLEKLGRGAGRVALVGYSFGGAVATHFTAKHPERVERLALSGAWATWRPIPRAARWTLKLGLGAALRRAWWSSVERALREGFEDSARHADVIENMLRVEREIVARDEEKFWRAILGTMRDFETDTRSVVCSLAERHIPTLLVWGRSDNVSPVEDARAMSAALPGAELIVLEGSHNDPWLVPGMREPLRDALAQFLRAARP